ncbi:hypothetical protein BJ322DRAFT_1108007 [Thelephora terrestris]|uniref:Homeobox KN domain-containing protein n=1 Tax=Thelephora terrestris TaxID=56493 RepID=A0A9P6HFL3_9AGAM|nr:hypothetical protein BJ322DRAFT_1108007 [Thelephora terrestris]
MPYENPMLNQDDLLSAAVCDEGNQETLSEVILSRLNIVSQYLANVDAAAAALTSSTMSEFEDIFSSLSLESFATPTQPVAVVSPTQWLLDNLHNPYPPVAVKHTMEESPELGNRTVNEWFARARQRIGWTRLLRDRFGGCRSAATDAAFRAFVRDDPRSPLDAELCAAFMAVKAHATLVYTPSSPGTLDTAPRLSPQPRSPSATPSLTHSADSEDSDDSSSQPPRKRKRSSSERPSEPSLASPPPLRKRRLAPFPERTSSPSHSHPSTSPTTDSSPPSPPRSRKRRLSESNSDEPVVKKPRGSDWAQRKQTVSDPLPLPTPSFDWGSWCTEAFALPPSATTNHPVPDALDFELFNFEAFPTSQPTDVAKSVADAHPKFSEQPDAWLDSLFTSPNQTEDPLTTSWESFFNFELPCNSSPLPSLTNSPSPSTPGAHWTVSPPEPSCFESSEPPLFDFSSPSLFKIPTLYPTEGVQIVDSDPLITL